MVVVTNLNRRLKSPADKAVQEGKPIAKFITGPTRSVQDFQAPDPFLGKFKTNPRSDSFYQMFADPEISQADIDKVLKIEKRHFGALTGQGLVQTALKNYKKAIDSYIEAHKVHPFMKSPMIMMEKLQIELQKQSI